MNEHSAKQFRPTTRRLLVAFCLLVLSCSIQCTGSRSAQSGRSLEGTRLGLVYCSTRDGEDRGALYFQDLEAREERRLTPPDQALSVYNSFSWSPAAGKVAYDVGRYDETEIYTVDLTGQHRRRLTDNDVADAGPRWSPDGSKITFARQGGEVGDQAWRSYVMNANGKRQTRLFDDTNVVGGTGAWSPDGRRMSIAVNDLLEMSFSNDIWILNTRDWGVNSRISDGLVHGAQVWSPDGKKLGFLAMAPEARATALHPSLAPFQLYVLDLATGESIAVSDVVGVLSFSWSPNSEYLVFTGPVAEFMYSVYTVRADGTEQARVTDQLPSTIGGSWSPDGRYIAFSGAETVDDSFNLDVYVLDVETGELLRMTEHAAEDYLPIWVTW